MSIMRKTIDMFIRITSRIPRRLYFTIKRFFLLAGSIVGGGLAILLIFMLVDWSVVLFGNPFPAIGGIIIVALGVASYFMAKIDVYIEKSEQERVLRILEKD